MQHWPNKIGDDDSQILSTSVASGVRQKAYLVGPTVAHHNSMHDTSTVLGKIAQPVLAAHKAQRVIAMSTLPAGLRGEQQHTPNSIDTD